MNSPLNRRHFLRNASVCIALPFLESVGFRRFASAATLAPRPKRMIFLAMGWGVTNETWYPDPKQTGAEWTLSEGLKPLAAFQKDITVVQNTFHKHSSDAHSCSTFWLTGANRYGIPGRSFHNTISVDQVAAEQFGQDTRFGSLAFSNPGGEGGHGSAVSWNRQGKPVADLSDPVAVFHKLFSDEKTPLSERKAQLQREQSVLDTVLIEAKDTARGLSREDTDKLNEYLESIREIEIRLAKEEQWLTVPKVKPTQSITEPGKGLSGEQEVKLMYDLMVAAFQTDATRVISYRQPVQSLLRSRGYNLDGHNMSHYSMGPRMEASQARDKCQSELTAYLIQKLKATKEPDGSSLFDHVSVALGSNVRTAHQLDNCPLLLTGRGAGIKLGHHLVMPDPKTPLCNVWLSLLHGVGVRPPSFGDSTGILDALMA
ncbi:MAG: hypothetical protein RLZZ399_648 [Verrucomicrobiota bacterium]|jgi:hypothetical protein